MTYFGSGICSHTRRRRLACFFVTGPVTIRMSAWRTEFFASIPNLSTSNRGVSVAITSMSHALHAPLLNTMIQGDFIRAQFTRRRDSPACGFDMINNDLFSETNNPFIVPISTP